MDLEAKLDFILKELNALSTKIDEKFKQIDNRFEQIDKKIDAKFEQIDKRFNQIDEKFKTIDNKLDSLSSEVGTLHRTLFKLDVDTQEKLSTLFEANKMHTDKELLFEKQLYRLTDQLENTIFRISDLEKVEE